MPKSLICAFWRHGIHRTSLHSMEPQRASERDAVTTQELTQDLVVPLDDIELSRSTASWSVAQSGWKQLLPDLPDDVIAMLATPVVVTAESLAPRQPVAVPVPAPVECAPMFLAPAPPRRLARQRRFARG
jgi:hypothetical protein